MGFLQRIKNDLNGEPCTKKKSNDETLQVTEESIPEEEIEIKVDGFYRIFVKKQVECVRENSCSSSYSIRDYVHEDRYYILIKTCLDVKILNQTRKVAEEFELAPFCNSMYTGLSYTKNEVEAYEKLIEILNSDEEKSKIIERIKRMATKEIKTYCKDLNLLKMKDFVKENGKIKINMTFTMTESELED